MAAGVKMFPEYCASLDTLLPLIGDSSCLLPVDHIQKRRSSPPQLAFLGKAGFNDEEGLNTMSDVIAAGVRILATVSCVQSTESFITVTPPKTQSMSYLLPRYHGNFVLVYWNRNGVPATPGSLLELTESSVGGRCCRKTCWCKSSTVLFLYWLVVVIADVVPFYTIILEQFLPILTEKNVFAITSLKLMSRGFREELQEKDVFELKPSDTSSANGPVLMKSWRREQERRALRGKSTSLHDVATRH
ncbi:hypothetical protein C0Q70_11852 [Pomacea canaliculata]|uniref:Uncharacterized protein n=1 Tax=Pomacea canaliculata TaxID=400727 RepID=A0A2T7P745_POMCA|nr:hypothetical protein C0Q70_11852 [Pomacea canaliculata]